MKLLNLLDALRARRHYRVLGYADDALPCIHCLWYHRPEDSETPWQWVLCDNCDWGNV